MRRLSPVKVQDAIEMLAEHAIESNLAPVEISEQIEKRYMEIVSDLEGGNCCAMSRRMGLHRNTIARRIQRLGIERKGYTVKHGNREASIA